MSAEATKFVGSIPENYDRGLGPHLFVDYADDLSRRVAAHDPESVLELAAGTGIVTRKLRDTLADSCDLVASDLNPPMLEVASAKFGPSERVRFEQADATDLPFGEASFDVVVCQFGVMFFPDRERSYAEVRRVLRPGGHYVFNTWGSWEDNRFARIAYGVTERFFPDDPPVFYRVPFGYHDADEIRKSMLEAGFARVDVQAVSFRPKIPSANRFAQGLVFGNPLIDEIRNRGGDAEAICDAMADAIETHLGAEMSLSALVVEATSD